jgi:hypothetical protein
LPPGLILLESSNRGHEIRGFADADHEPALGRPDDSGQLAIRMADE